MEINSIAPFIRSVSCFPFTWINKEASVSYDCRFFYVLNGEGEVLIQDEKQVLSKYSLILFQPGTKYQFQSNSKNPLELFTINFDYTLKNSQIREVIPTQSVSSFVMENVLEQYTQEPLSTPICLKNMSVFENDVLQILNEYRIKKLYYEGKISSILKTILLSVFRISQEPSCAGAYGIAPAVIDYIHTHYMDSLTNQSISEAFGYHPYYIGKLVRNYTGKTLHHYILSYRLYIAKHLLRTLELPLEEIALQTGFQNYSHFSYAFKKSFAQSPSDFRKGQEHLIL